MARRLVSQANRAFVHVRKSASFVHSGAKLVAPPLLLAFLLLIFFALAVVVRDSSWDSIVSSAEDQPVGAVAVFAGGLGCAVCAPVVVLRTWSWTLETGLGFSQKCANQIICRSILCSIALLLLVAPAVSLACAKSHSRDLESRLTQNWPSLLSLSFSGHGCDVRSTFGNRGCWIGIPRSQRTIDFSARRDLS